MNLTRFKTPVVFLLFGIMWAMFSDPLITRLEEYISVDPDSVRGLNDVLFVLLAAIILYARIRSERKKLEQSERQFRIMFFSNPNPMMLYDRETLRFIMVNQETLNKYGYTNREFKKMTIMDIRPANDRKRVTDALMSLSDDINNMGNWRHISKAGEVFKVSIVLKQIKFNNRDANLVVVTDITEMMNQKEELEAANAGKQQLIDELQQAMELKNRAAHQSAVMSEAINEIYNPILMLNAGGAILWANKAFCRYTGYTLSELLGKRPVDFLYGPQSSLDTISKITSALAGKRHVEAEIIKYKKSGIPYWAQLNISPIFDKVTGEFEFYISVENIVTSRKAKEEQLRSQYQTFKRIAWSSSHEVRRPLASILGIVNLFNYTTNTVEKQELLQMLEMSSKELDQIVTQNVEEISEMNELMNPEYQQDDISDDESNQPAAII